MGWIGDEDDRRREALRDADAAGHGLRGALVDGWSSLLHVLRTRPVLGISVVILALAIFGASSFQDNSWSALCCSSLAAGAA